MFHYKDWFSFQAVQKLSLSAQKDLHDLLLLYLQIYRGFHLFQV